MEGEKIGYGELEAGSEGSWRYTGIILGEKSPEFCAERGREFLWLALLSQGQLQDEEQGALGMKDQESRTAAAVESPAGFWSWECLQRAWTGQIPMFLWILALSGGKNGAREVPCELPKLENWPDTSGRVYAQCSSTHFAAWNGSQHFWCQLVPGMH